MKCMIRSSSAHINNDVEVSINYIKQEITQQVKYLGVIIHTNLIFASQLIM